MIDPQFSALINVRATADLVVQMPDGRDETILVGDWGTVTRPVHAGAIVKWWHTKREVGVPAKYLEAIR